MVILHPYEPILQPEPTVGVREAVGLSVVSEGRHGIILCLGNRLVAAHQLREILLKEYQSDFGLVCVRAIKPLPKNRIIELCESAQRVVTLEESILQGGFGSLICETLSDSDVNASVLRSGIDNRFVPPGGKDECSKECGIEPRQVLEKVLQRWSELASKE